MTPDACLSSADVMFLLDSSPEDDALRRHVERCTECAARLAQARALRATAQAHIRDASAAGDAGRRARFAARLRAEAAPRVDASRPPARSFLSRHRWALVPASLVLATVAGVVLMLQRSTLAAETVRLAVALDVRAAAAAGGHRETRMHVKALPLEATGRSSGCAPWQAMLPLSRTAVTPSVAVDLLVEFFGIANDRVQPVLALGESYDAWRRRRAGWTPNEDVFDASGVRVVGTTGRGGLVHRAELIVQRPSGAAVHVRLVGAGCSVEITPVMAAPEAARDGPGAGLPAG